MSISQVVGLTLGQTWWTLMHPPLFSGRIRLAVPPGSDVINEVELTSSQAHQAPSRHPSSLTTDPANRTLTPQLCPPHQRNILLFKPQPSLSRPTPRSSHGHLLPPSPLPLPPPSDSPFPLFHCSATLGRRSPSSQQPNRKPPRPGKRGTTLRRRGIPSQGNCRGCWKLRRRSRRS